MRGGEDSSEHSPEPNLHTRLRERAFGWACHARSRRTLPPSPPPTNAPQPHLLCAHSPAVSAAHLSLGCWLPGFLTNMGCHGLAPQVRAENSRENQQKDGRFFVAKFLQRLAEEEAQSLQSVSQQLLSSSLQNWRQNEENFLQLSRELHAGEEKRARDLQEAEAKRKADMDALTSRMTRTAADARRHSLLTICAVNSCCRCRQPLICLSTHCR